MNKNTQTALNLAAIIVGMFGLAYASVPLYDLFCKVTGFGGAVSQSSTVPDKIYDRKIKVLFNADVNAGLKWRFEPLQSKEVIKVGETGLAFYEAENLSDRKIIGTSTYNVTPIKMAEYFNKIECFCFTQQVLEPGEKMQFPVSFFIDPEIMNDKKLDEVKTVTLSYTFFEYKDDNEIEKKNSNK